VNGQTVASGAAPLRFAIVGCGAIAVNHVRALRSIPGVEVTAAIDSHPGRARQFAHDHGVPASFDEIEQGLDSGIDAVTVCTPHRAHEAGVLAAAERGLHVLCEKPIATTVAEADRMITATDAAAVRFGVVYQRRMWASARRIRAALDDGSLGQPVTGSCAVRLRRDADYFAEPWRGRWDTEGGGVLMTQAIHHIDLLQWFMGDAVAVSGRIATLKHGDLIEVEDTAVATIEFASGALAVLQAGTTYRPALGARVMVSDREGRTASVLEYPEGSDTTDVWTVDEPYGFVSPLTEGGAYDPPLPEVHSRLRDVHTLQLVDFVDAVRQGRDPAVTGREARKSLEIVAAVYESDRTGVPVKLQASTARVPS
jgi:UDP-N-acetyl-2-amino-2-deoxyglucuronate dehydrogenase